MTNDKRKGGTENVQEGNVTNQNWKFITKIVKEEMAQISVG
jgi:hypothetical protein